MTLFLSMATPGPEWMGFLIPIVVLLALIEGGKKLYKWIGAKLSHPPVSKVKISNFTPDDFNDQLN